MPNLLPTALICFFCGKIPALSKRHKPQLKDVVVIVSSASVFETDQHKSLLAGGSDFLPKPVQVDDLLHKLQKHLQLEWVYEEEEIGTTQDRRKDKIDASSSDQSPPTAIIAPPQEELEALFKLAKQGNLKRILAQVEKLEHLDEKFVPFATKLRQLVEECQVKKIKEFISLYTCT